LYLCSPRTPDTALPLSANHSPTVPVVTHHCAVLPPLLPFPVPIPASPPSYSPMTCPSRRPPPLLPNPSLHAPVSLCSQLPIHMIQWSSALFCLSNHSFSRIRSFRLIVP
jgi:hypothetical protein